MLSQSKFGKMVGVGAPAINALVKEGILRSGATAGDWLRAYCERLREGASGRSLSLIEQRARHAKELADREAMANDERRKTLFHVSLYERLLTETARRAAAILEAVPSVIRRRCSGIDPTVYQIVEEEIARARNLASILELPLEDIDGHLRAEAGASDGDAGLGRSESNAPQRMG
jgi:phage terminase Nu1 subunit (DNA packaging protein)